jgi:WD40 repeat protein
VRLEDPYPTQRLLALPPALSVSAGGTSVGPAFRLQPAARFSPDSGLVVTWGRTKAGAQVWLPFGTRKLARLRASSYGRNLSLLLPTVLSRDGRLVATAGRIGEITVWSTRDGRRLSTLRGSTGFVSSIAFSPAGDLLAAAGFDRDRAVRIWRVTDGSLVHTLRGHTARVGGVAFSPDGKLVASASEDQTARIWRLPSGDLVQVLREPAGPVTSVSFSRDGGTLVTAGGGGNTRVWSTRNWRQHVVLGPTRSRTLVLHASFSGDGRVIATLDLNGTARIWHSDGGAPIRTLKNVATVAFSPKGDQLLVGGGEATVRILRPSDGAELGLLRGHMDVVNDARFSPDADLIVTAGNDATARVWHAATNGTVAVVTPSWGAVVQAMLAADGRLITVSDDGVRLYACEPCLRPARLQALAKERLASAR